MKRPHIERAVALSRRIAEDLASMQASLAKGDFEGARGLGVVAPMMAYAARTAHEAAMKAAQSHPDCTPEFVAERRHAFEAAHLGELPGQSKHGDWN